MRGPRPFRIFLVIILTLTPLAQPFWFVRAWRVIDAIAWPGPRYLLQSLWMVAVLVVLAAVLDLTVGHMISRRDLWPWGRAVGRLWLITPFVAGLYRLPLGHEAHTAGAEVKPRRPKSAFLYVNRGLGTFGLPVRLGVPPEITVLTLRAVG